MPSETVKLDDNQFEQLKLLLEQIVLAIQVKQCGCHHYSSPHYPYYPNYPYYPAYTFSQGGSVQ